MKILSKLVAAPHDAPDQRPPGTRQMHVREITPGQFIRSQLSDHGLFLECNSPEEKHAIFIPMQELYALAAEHNPSFTPRAQVKVMRPDVAGMSAD